MAVRLAFAGPAPWRMTAAPARPASSPTAPPIPNLRDIASAAPRLARPGALYRGAAPSCVPRPKPGSDVPDPAVAFLSRVGVFVDLRSRDERVLDPCDRIAELCGHDYAARVAAIPLLNRRRVLVGLARVLPREQTRDLVVRSLRSPTRAKGAIVSRMDQGGLILLNRVLLQSSGAAMARALKVITRALQDQKRSPGFVAKSLQSPSQSIIDSTSSLTNSSSSLPISSPPSIISSSFSSLDSDSSLSSTPPSSPPSAVWTPYASSTPLHSLDYLAAGVDPVYIYCSAGKDRTGMLVALILSTIGASHDMIIRDYVKSAETWVNGPYHLRADYSARLEHSGLTPNTWLGASADIMESTLSYIDEKFGSTEAYLARAGMLCRSLWDN
jgi:hypothetical protein